MSFNPSVMQYAPIVNQAARQYGLDPNLLFAVIQQESGGRVDARSPAGAQGLMQLMPGTASALGVSNPYDARQNIFGGAKYLSQQINTFGSVEQGLAAYNAGPGNVSKYGGIPPFSETRNYVSNITSMLQDSGSPLSATGGSLAGAAGSGLGSPLNPTQTPQSALQSSSSIVGIRPPDRADIAGIANKVSAPTPTLAPPEQRTPQIQKIAEAPKQAQQIGMQGPNIQNIQSQAGTFEQSQQRSQLEEVQLMQEVEQASNALQRQQEAAASALNSGLQPATGGANAPGGAGLGLGVAPQPGQFSVKGDESIAAPLFNSGREAWRNLVDFVGQFGGNIQGDFQTTGGAHAPGSYHYSGRAIDLGNATVGQQTFQSLGAYAQRNPWLFKEFFYDPLGFYIKNGQIVQGSIGGHGDHMHIAV